MRVDEVRLGTAGLLLIAVAAVGQTASAKDAANPAVVSAVAPTYPRSRFSNPSRTVLVGLTVNTDGVPEKVHVVRSGGERFDRNAVATVAQYRFTPARKDGVAVAREIQVEVSYKAK